MNELKALQNAVNSSGCQFLSIQVKPTEDKRKTINRYFLDHVGFGTISPVLDYEQMNHFILGFSKAFKIYNHENK